LIQQLTFHTKNGKVWGPFGKLTNGTKFTAKVPNDECTLGHVYGVQCLSGLGLREIRFTWVKANFVDLSTDLLKNSNIVLERPEVCDRILDLAVRDSNIQIIKLLEQAGFDLDTPGFDRRKTALHMSVFNGKSALLQFLLDAGVNVNVQDLEGKTPLHYAIELKDLESAKMLIEYGAELMNDKIGQEKITELANGWDEYHTVYKFHEDFQRAVTDAVNKDENKYANLSSNEIQYMKELKVRQLEKVNSSLSTVKLKMNELSDLKVAKLLEVEEKQNDCADKFNAKKLFLDDEISIAIKKVKALEAKMDVAKQNYIKACVDLSEEKEMILVDMESKEENLKKERIEKSTIRFQFNHELKLIKSECKRKDDSISTTSFSDKSKSDDKFMRYLEEQIKNLETELECPICLQPAEVPIYTCNLQHTICGVCWNKMDSTNRRCPSCRVPFSYPPAKHRLMEKMAEQLKQSYKELDNLLSSHN